MAARRGRGGSKGSVIQAGQQRVAAEQGHEPRRPGGDDGAVRVCPVDDAQRGEVGERLVDGGPSRGSSETTTAAAPPAGHAVDRDRGRPWRATGRDVDRVRRPGDTRCGSSPIDAAPRSSVPRERSVAGRRRRRWGFAAHRVDSRRRRRPGDQRPPVAVARRRPASRGPLLTSNTWAKSAAIDHDDVDRHYSPAVWRTSMSSRIPPPIQRRRMTRHDDGTLSAHRRRAGRSPRRAVRQTCWRASPTAAHVQPTPGSGTGDGDRRPPPRGSARRDRRSAG